jgi:hypothetical protein
MNHSQPKYGSSTFFWVLLLTNLESLEDKRYAMGSGIKEGKKCQ